MLVPCEGEEGVPPIHQIAGDEGVRINDGRQGVGGRASDETDHKENLQNRKSHPSLDQKHLKALDQPQPTGESDWMPVRLMNPELVSQPHHKDK